MVVPVTEPAVQKKRTSQAIGLRYWMLRALDECDNVSVGFSADPVHDLRVSLRRCRSLADGLMALDPDAEWKAMKKAGKKLFQRLGALRDIQVMEEWIDKLDPETEDAAGGEKNAHSAEPQAELQPASDNFDPQSAAPIPAKAMRRILAGREQEEKREAKAALEEFDRKKWRQWAKSLPGRASRFRPGSALFKHLALERWTEARELHNLAMRGRSSTALHALRIGIKRFRYIVENFLPAEHKAWSGDLKHMQDLLGEVHDLDVLWSTMLSCEVFSAADSRRKWHERLSKERAERVAQYREKMVGPESLWHVWREALPYGKEIQEIAAQRVRMWAKGLDPDYAHSHRVTRFAVDLYKGLSRAGMLRGLDGVDSEGILRLAGMLHDVGKSKGERSHHKKSFQMIRGRGAPLGMEAARLQRAAIVARFHQGALPTRRHQLLRDLLPDEQRVVLQLAAILRLANAFDPGHDGHIRRLQLAAGAKSQGVSGHDGLNGFRLRNSGMSANQALIITAEGYSPYGPAARAIAAERHLLETVLRRPILVKPLRPH